MGGCVATLMDKRNQRSITTHPDYTAYNKIRKEQGLVAEGTEEAGASAIYRMVGCHNELQKQLTRDNYNAVNSVQELKEYCEERGDQVMFAYRKLIKVEKQDVVENGRTTSIDMYVFDPKHQTISYKQHWQNIINFGKGLAGLGLQKGARVAIFEETRWEWLTTMYGIWTQGMIAATVYANLGEAALVYSLRETECGAIICNGKDLPKLVKLFTDAGLQGTKIIYIGDALANCETQQFDTFKWADVVEAGKVSAAEVYIPGPEAADDVALIMYTSGTTGDPKGVVHTFGSLTGGVRALRHRVLDLLGPKTGPEWYCSYLPLAHIMEFMVVNILLWRGVTVGFGSPRTLLDKFARPHGDLTEFKPDLFVAVPRVYDSVKKAVLSKLPPVGTLKRTVFDNAYKARLAALKEGNDTPYYNEKVFAVPRAVMGGRVRAMLSGGGPLSASTQEFINVVFGMVSQGWGLTETSCCGTIQRMGNLCYNNVGQLLQTAEVRLLDTEAYKHTDTPEPRGELLIRGQFLFKGYYKQDKLTKEAIDADGWFHTGDVGSVTAEGTIRLVGRVKALAKNLNGEYIALETLESIYGTNSVCIPGCICVLVNPSKSYICAIGATDAPSVTAFLKDQGISGSYPRCLTEPAFRKAVAASLQATARSAGRKGFEMVRHVLLLSDEWTPENGALTAAMKLKRSVIDTMYAKEIQELFSDE